MIRLAVFDIDRTLISPDAGVIAPETVTALKQLQGKGIKTAVASGRIYAFLQKELLELGFDYYIMSNGGFVADRAGNVLAQEALDPRTVAALVEKMVRLDLPIDIRYGLGRRTGNPNQSLMEWAQPIWSSKKFEGETPRAFLVEHEPREGEAPISFGGYIPKEYLPEFEAEFPQLEFLPVFESPMCDINPVGINKADGLRRVCALTGIDLSETIAFGDDRNDLEMIRAAGIGVAVGNGIQVLKDAADYVTDTCENLGVVKAIVHFGLLD